MEKIKITLTQEEAQELLSLVSESKDTGNEDWDKTMQSIYEKIYKEL